MMAHMEIDKLVTFATEYLSRYAQAFVGTLRSPSAQFAPLRDQLVLVDGDANRSSFRLNPELLTFATLSVIIGMLLNSVLPAGGFAPSLTIAVIVVLLVWFIMAGLLHVALRLLGGDGHYEETATVVFQVCSVIYVFCNFVAMLIRVAGSLLFVAPRLASPDLATDSVDASLLVEVWVYYPIQFLMLCVYLPLALRRVHRLSRWRALVAIVLMVVVWAVIFACVSFILLMAIHGPAKQETISSSYDVSCQIRGEYLRYVGVVSGNSTC